MTKALQRYHSVAKLLHWVMALVIIAMLAIGWIMTDEDLVTGSLRFALYQWHKSLGITILALSLVRLGWRFYRPPPSLPITMRPWEKFIAATTHWLFYGLMIGMPLTGWLLSSASPFKTVLFGVLPLPNLPFVAEAANRQQLGEVFSETHETLALVLAGLIVLHIGAAWKHHLFNRDDVLLRMAPQFLHPLLLRLQGKT